MTAGAKGHSTIIDAPAEAVVAALLGFEQYPQWQSGVQECTVLERDDRGRGRLVEFTVDAKITKIRYTTRYFYDLDRGRLGWDYVSGDLKQCRGRYQLTTAADGRTSVAADITAEPAFYLPGPMKRMLREQAIKNSLRDLERRVRP